MRRILLLALKILVTGGLLYLALRKVDFHDLASRFNVASFGWIGLAIAATFIQIFLGVLRWREVSAECDAPLGLMQAARFNMIGQFFNQETQTIRMKAPDVTAYLHFRIKTFTAYLHFENLNTLDLTTGQFTKNNVFSPNYPYPGLQMRIGVYWSFIN